MTQELNHTLCPIQKQIGHVPVPATRQGDDFIFFSRDELVIIKLNPVFVCLLDPRDIVPRICTASLVCQDTTQLILACTEHSSLSAVEADSIVGTSTCIAGVNCPGKITEVGLK